MAQGKEQGAGPVCLKVSVNLLECEGAERVPKVLAYAFTSGGRLLAQQAPDERGTATLTFPGAAVARAVRVMVGPDLEEQEVRISELLRRGAAERLLRIDPPDLTPSVTIAVIPDTWLCWLLSLCFVRGTLLKRADLDGVIVDLPVCDAMVEVYEVDPLPILIWRLPDSIIEKMREIIRGERIPEILPPIGPIGPFPPPPPGPGPQPFIARPITSANPSTGTASGTKAGNPGTGQRTLSQSTDLQLLARSTDTFQFRQVLLDYPYFIRAYLCHYFPLFVTKRLVATATTDECGRFLTAFFRGCNNPDTPDLYFKAKQRIFPAPFLPLTIYAPTPVACFTHWNYVCGSEVTLYTTHPLAVTCSPCPPVIAPNNWVLAMAVGNLPLSRIRGTSVDLQATTDATNLGLTDAGAPFGGLLRLRLEFDNSLREDLNVQYYRVSYRKGASGSFTPLTSTVNRHYTHEVGGGLELEVFNLGPKVVNSVPNLFEIPPALPPEGQWSFPDLLEDLTNAKFPTRVLAPGLDPNDPAAPDQSGEYQLKVDLFDKDGNLVDIDAAGKQIKYRVPDVMDLSGDITTSDADAELGLVADDDGDGKRSFLMTLHIDNNVCIGSIAPPTLGGISASDECGVLEYQPGQPGQLASVTMEYTASHPNGFATYSFRLFRGANVLTLPPAPATPTLPASGQVPSPPGTLSNVQTVGDLLGACSVAGFSENLYVAAMATDGWSRLSGYDAHDVRAFVLSPP